MGVVLGWQSSASASGGLGGPNSIPVDSFIPLGPRSGDVSGPNFSTQDGAPLYVLAYGFRDGTSHAVTWTFDAGWTLAHSYTSPTLAAGLVAALFTKPFAVGMTDFHFGCSAIVGSTGGVGMAPWLPLTAGQSILTYLEVGTDSWAPPTVPGVAGLITLGPMAAPDVPGSLGIMTNILNDGADFRDSTGPSPHFFGGPYMNGSSNRGVVAAWNEPDDASYPSIVVGPGTAESVAYGIAFSDSRRGIPFPADPLTDSIRVKPEYRPLTYESGGCIVFV